MRYTYYFSFDDEASALSALQEWRLPLYDDMGTPVGSAWSTYADACVDAPIVVLTSEPIIDPDTGAMKTPPMVAPGYYANLQTGDGRPELELLAAWLGTMNTDTGEMISGLKPVHPTRIFQ